jgi:dCMP deaminase
MKQAIETAKNSKCMSRHVGALIVVEDRIVSEGYNGTPKGYVNCNVKWNNIWHADHHEWSKTHEIHAEMNAINWAARKGIKIEDGVMYCTTKPCLECTKNIIAVGIKAVYWLTKYEYNEDHILDSFFKENNVICEQVFLPEDSDYSMIYGNKGIKVK